MGVMGGQSRLLSTRPAVRRDEDTLVIGTRPLYRALSLGSYGNEVVIDKSLGTVVVTRRRMWLFVTQDIMYIEDLQGISYGRRARATSLSFGGIRSTDTVESYTLSLVDKSGEVLEIYTFRGEGSVAPGWGPGSLGDDTCLFDRTGTQAQDSRHLLTELQRFTGLPVQR